MNKMDIAQHPCKPPKIKGFLDGGKQQKYNGTTWACHCGRTFRGRVYAHPAGWRLVWHPVKGSSPSQSVPRTPGQHRAPRKPLFQPKATKFEVTV